MSFDPTQTTRIIVAKAKRRIVKDWRSRLGDYSTKALALGTAAAAAWVALPGDLKGHLPSEAVAWVIGALNAYGLVGKFVIQNPPEASDANK